MTGRDNMAAMIGTFLYRITDGKIAKDWADDGLAILAEPGVYTPARMQQQ